MILIIKFEKCVKMYNKNNVIIELTIVKLIIFEIFV